MNELPYAEIWLIILVAFSLLGVDCVPSITFTTWELQPGVHLHVAPTEKFKTVRMRISMLSHLQRDTATAHALIPRVLRRGSTKFPTQQDIATYLESLYGAAFGVDTRKIGEAQLMEAQFHGPSERFIPEATDELEKSVQFLSEVLLHPRVVDDAFEPQYVTSERRNMHQRIAGLVDQRFQYALQRCYANMCQNEPFGTYRYGQQEDLDSIDPHNLYKRYDQYIQSTPTHIVVVGALEPSVVKDLFAQHFVLPRGQVWDLPDIPRVTPKQTRTVVERLPIQQGVLVLGCRLPIRFKDGLYPALLVYNGILGGYSHSKLFREVREKASLAYTAFSRMETVKGVQVMFAGIDVNNFGQARDIMLEQLEAVQNGRVSEQEMSDTKHALINGLRSSLDSANQIIHNHLFGAVGGKQRDIFDLIEAIEHVSLDDVVRVANGVELDTVYFLRNQEEEEQDI